MSIRETLEDVFEKLSQNANVEKVFGKERQVGKKTILPVAKISFGGGGGRGESTEEDDSGKGEGFGGGLAVQPLGCYVVEEDDVRWIPTIDFNKLIFVGSLLSIFALMTIKSAIKSGK